MFKVLAVNKNVLTFYRWKLHSNLCYNKHKKNDEGEIFYAR